eukprot:3074165-Rhodomonas_salina.2
MTTVSTGHCITIVLHDRWVLPFPPDPLPSSLRASLACRSSAGTAFYRRPSNPPTRQNRPPETLHSR